MNLKCIDRGGGFRRSGLKRYAGPFKPQQTVRTGDLVMAVTDMRQERMIVAQTGRVPRLNEPEAIVSMDLIRVVPVEGVAGSYLHGFLRWSRFAEEVRHHANGANVLHLNPQRVADYATVVPARRPMREFAECIEPLLDLGDVLEAQSGDLRMQRDLLLPKLISGEIDVSEAPSAEEVAAA